MTDWIEAERLQRIAEGEAKYGPWTAENFRLTGRGGVNEAIPELLDSLSYLEMGYQLGEMTAAELNYDRWILTNMLERLDRKRSKQI